MIALSKYSKQMEEDYYNAVSERVDKVNQDKIVIDCKKIWPQNHFTKSLNFEKLILMPYSEIKSAMSAINKDEMEKVCLTKVTLKPKKFYKTLINVYKSVGDSTSGKRSMRVRLVDSQRLTVCPYCNRDYINSRGGEVSGAQLDHFYSKDNYPFLAVSLYNLIPVCGNCNRVKSKKEGPFASVFDTDIDFDNSLAFDYSDDLTEIQLHIMDGIAELDNNITGMKIKEAYQIHILEVKELLELENAYKETQLWEIRDTLGDAIVSDEYIKRIIFGPRIGEEDILRKPLGKMMKDLHKKLKIYS